MMSAAAKTWSRVQVPGASSPLVGLLSRKKTARGLDKEDLPVAPERGSQVSAISTSAPRGEGMKVGDVYEMEKVFGEQEVSAYAQLAGDTNPIHLDESAALQAKLPGRVVHGMLCAGLFPAIIGTRQAGAVYLSQTLNFRKTVLLGEPVCAEVAVEKVSGSRAVLVTKCFKVCPKEGRVLVLDGKALALLPREPHQTPST